MLEFEFLQRVSTPIRTLREFPLPALIVDKAFAVCWSNALARSLFPTLCSTQGFQDAIAEFDAEALRSDLLTRGNALLRDVFMMGGVHLSFSPILDGDELVGAVVLLIGNGVTPVFEDTLQTGRAAGALSGGIHAAVTAMFGTMDITATKASVMGASWLLPNLERVGTHLYHIMRIAENITLYSACQNGSTLLNRQTVDICPWLEQRLEAAEILAGQLGVELTYSLPETSVLVRIDEAKIETALYGVLHNALYFSRAGNYIEVQAKKNGRTLELVIRDHGLGIPAREQEKIFRPFYAYRHSETQETVGLGLTLARLLLRAHGGDVTLASVHGEGTQVTLALPEISFSDPLPLGQRDGGPEIDNRFSKAYTGLSDLTLSPYLSI